MGCRIGIELGRGDVGPRVAEDVRHLVRVAAEEHGVEVLPVDVRVDPVRRRDVFLAVRRGVLRLEVHDQPDPVAPLRAVRLDRHRVRTQQVVRDDGRLLGARVPGREHAVQVPAVGDDPGLVQRRPEPHAFVQRAEHDAGVVGEPAGDVGVEPAAALVQRGGQVPVVQRGARLDAVLAQGVDESAVEVEARSG